MDCVRDIFVTQIGFAGKLITLREHIHWPVCQLRQKSDCVCACTVHNGPVLQHNLCPHEHTVDVADVVTHFVLSD